MLDRATWSRSQLERRPCSEASLSQIRDHGLGFEHRCTLFGRPDRSAAFGTHFIVLSGEDQSPCGIGGETPSLAGAPH
jgi:hypothetical protein